jgi:hypothetical protein
VWVNTINNYVVVEFDDTSMVYDPAITLGPLDSKGCTRLKPSAKGKLLKYHVYFEIDLSTSTVRRGAAAHVFPPDIRQAGTVDVQD